MKRILSLLLVAAAVLALTGRSLCEANIAIRPGYISGNAGERISDPDYLYTDVFYLPQGQTVSFKCAAPSGVWLLSEWSADGQFLRGLVPGDGKYHRLTYTAEHSMWLRACTRSNAVYNVYAAPEEFRTIRFYDEAVRLKEHPLYGKTIVALGDSLFHGNLLGNEGSWLKILEQQTGANVLNYGIPGIPLASCSAEPSFSIAARYTRIPELAEADIVLVLGGANDRTQDIPLGTADDQNSSTFLGACNVLIDGLRSINPTAQLLFFSPYPRFSGVNSVGLSDADYSQAMVQFCREKGIPCFDNHNDCDLSFLDESTAAWCDEGIYLGIGANAHFSPRGNDRLAELYIPWITENTVPNIIPLP